MIIDSGYVNIDGTKLFIEDETLLEIIELGQTVHVGMIYNWKRFVYKDGTYEIAAEFIGFE